MWALAACWYDWWGGWCFGYRQIVDTTPLLAVLLVPVIDRLFERKAALAVGAALLAWSVAVQWVGVWSYNDQDWNSPEARIGKLVDVPGIEAPLEVYGPLELERMMAEHPHARVVGQLSSDIDLPKNRWRLWSLADNQLLYFLMHYRAGHENRRKDCLKVKTDYFGAHYNLGLALATRGRTDEAIAEYEKALRIQPASAETYYNLGNAFAERGLVDEAIARYQAALALKSDYAEAHDNLGIALASRGRIDEAIWHYRKTLEIKPDDAEADNNLGAVLLACGRTGEAIAAYRRAVEVKPGSPEARKVLGIALAAGGRTDEAIAQFQKRWRSTPSTPRPTRTWASPFGHADGTRKRSGNSGRHCNLSPTTLKR